MGGTRLDLTDDLAIDQGYDFGPMRFKVRESDFEQLTYEITSLGSAGDVLSLSLFGSNSDRPEIPVTLTHTVAAGDTLASIADDFADQLNALTLEYDVPDGGVELFRFDASVDGAVVTFSPTEAGLHLDASESATGTADATLTVVVEVLVDLTDAVVEATGKGSTSDATPLFYWSTTGGEFTLADALRGVIDLDVDADTTATYTWESCKWEMSVETPTDGRRRLYFWGCAHNRLSLQ